MLNGGTAGDEVRRVRDGQNKTIRESVAEMMKLPFIKDLGEGKTRNRSFWHVEEAETGDYSKDCDIGHTYGMQLLEFVRRNPMYSDVLAQTVRSMSTRKKWTGIEVGFMGVFNNVLYLTAGLVIEPIERLYQECLRAPE